MKRQCGACQLTPEQIRNLLWYDKSTGLFKWKNPSSRQAKGWFKGNKSVRKYRRILFSERRQILAHRVAWVIVTGKWPIREVEHRDRDQSNNKWENLREAAHWQNAFNRSRNKNNTTGVHGVTRFGKRYRVRIMVRQKHISLGLYSSLEDAAKVRKEAEQFYYGEFAP